jgi:hypothetical protein
MADNAVQMIAFDESKWVVVDGNGNPPGVGGVVPVGCYLWLRESGSQRWRRAPFRSRMRLRGWVSVADREDIIEGAPAWGGECDDA